MAAFDHTLDESVLNSSLRFVSLFPLEMCWIDDLDASLGTTYLGLPLPAS